MFRTKKGVVWAFDAEWVPDPMAGRVLYDLPEAMSDQDVLEVMWNRSGKATPENPRPFLKTALCRVVSICVLERKENEEQQRTHLRLHSFPSELDIESSPPTTEAKILRQFLSLVGRHRPQLIGFNSSDSDLRIMVQRALIAGIQAPDFCNRPEKPWFDAPDYFASGYSPNEYHHDLRNVFCGGLGTQFTLNEIARLCGIPGKMGTDGSQVCDLWMSGNLRDIVRYNQFDALTTYLVWLRTCHLAGLFTTEQYNEEQAAVETYLLKQVEEKESNEHLCTYLKEWKRLRRYHTQIGQ